MMNHNIAALRSEYQTLKLMLEGLVEIVSRRNACNLETMSRMAHEAKVAAQKIASEIERILFEGNPTMCGAGVRMSLLLSLQVVLMMVLTCFSSVLRTPKRRVGVGLTLNPKQNTWRGDIPASPFRRWLPVSSSCFLNALFSYRFVILCEPPMNSTSHRVPAREGVSLFNQFTGTSSESAVKRNQRPTALLHMDIEFSTHVAIYDLLFTNF